MRQTALSFNLVNVAVLMVVTLAGLMLSTMSVSARHTLAASGKTQQAAAARSTADGFPAAEFASLGPPRRLLAAADEMAVGIANFAALPAGLKGVVTVPNIELSGRIKAPPGGASGLGVTEANELAIILKTELVRRLRFHSPQARLSQLSQLLVFYCVWCTVRLPRVRVRSPLATAAS